MIKAIIFDCFGVLTKDWWRAFCETLPKGEVLDRAKELNHQYDAGLLSLQEFVSAVHEATGREPKPIEDIFSTPEPVKNSQLLQYIKELKSKYKIGMISNIGTPWITDSFLTKEEQALFDTMVLSFEVGITKPDPKIYQMTADKLGVEPNQCVFVDDITQYVEAAETLGMRGIVYSDLEQFKSDLGTLFKQEPN